MESCCRCCLSEESPPQHDLFEGRDPLRDKLSLCSGLTIIYEDHLPLKICDKCHEMLNISYQFRKICEASDAELKKIKLESKHSKTSSGFSNINWSNVKTPDSVGWFCKFDLSSPRSVHEENNINIIENNSNINSKKKSASKIKKKVKRSLKSDNSVNLPTKNKMHSFDHCPIIRNNKEKLHSTKLSHMCTICGKVFRFHGNLMDHERTHSGDKPYKCNSCNQSFTQAGHLLVHKRIHLGIKPYKCAFCPREFTVSNTLKKHLRIHTGERPFICQICNKGFITSYHLSTHYKRHVGDKTFKCDWPECGQSFVNISELKKHKRKHEKPRKSAEKILKSPIISLEGYSSRILSRNIGIDKQQTFPEIIQFAPTDYLNLSNAQDITLISSFHNQIGAHSQLVKNSKSGDFFCNSFENH